MSPEPCLMIWDSPAPAPRGPWTAWVWNGYVEEGGVRSLWRYVESRDQALRARYLSWIHDLGQSLVEGRSVVDWLALEKGLSFWWLTLLAEKSPWKSPAINDAIRLLALEEIASSEGVRGIRLASADHRLHEAVSRLCRGLGLWYEWERLSCRPASGWQGLGRILPLPVRALASLGKLSARVWALHGADTSGWHAGEKAIFICSYFRGGRDRGRDSVYWTGLQGLLSRIGLRANWLELYRPEGPADPKVALAELRRRNREDRAFGAFLESHFSLALLFRVLRRWARLALLSWRLRGVRGAFFARGSRAWLWPLLRRDWLDSLRGPDAINALLALELFDEALRRLPRQSKGLYVCENQGWERALIHAWRKHGHGRLIAVPHSPQRFWDLRFFCDRRSLETSPWPMPCPDFITVNGKTAMEAFRGGNYAPEALLECEALRYGYLSALPASRPGRHEGPIRILVLGEYLPLGTVKMLKLLEKALPLMPGPAACFVKSHPHFPVDPGDYPGLFLRLVSEPLSRVLRDFDLAVAGNMTSAAVDAYLAGLPLAVVLDERSINLSPLRGLAGVRFVATPQELAEAARAGASPESERRELLFLDPELPRWRSLVSA